MCSLFSFPLHAQQPTKISGKVVDAISKQGVEFASVVVLRAIDSSLVNGVYTDAKGLFSYSNLPFGKYIVRVTFMGYEKLEKGFELTAQHAVTVLPTLQLHTAGTNLKAVEIKTEKPAFSMQIDRQVFDAGSIITAEGGTGTDVLKGIPSVDVDIDNNVTLRGKSISVYIDGKPSPFGDPKTALEMIPAETIDRIEVISNPSSKFEAQGGGGIINIVLKKDRAMGYNVMMTGGIDTRGQMNAGFNGNLRLRKLNFFGSLNGRYGDQIGSGLSKRKNMFGDTTYFNQSNENKNISRGQNGKFGFDYYADNYNTISISTGFSNNYNSNVDSIYLNYLNNLHEQTKYSRRKNASESNGRNFNTSINYKRTFERANEELTAHVTYATYNSHSNSNYNTRTFVQPNDVQQKPNVRQNFGRGHNYNWDFQTDYTRPIGTKGKLEAGVKANVRENENDYIALNFNNTTQVFDTSITLSNSYQYKEKVFAGYFNYANTLGRVGYQVGLRAEQATLDGYSFTKDTSVNNRFTNFFPSLYLKYDLRNNQNLVFNYATRTDRPNFDQLLPYLNDSDPQNLRTGNPALQPAFTHKLEGNYTVYYPKSNNFFTTGVYYSRTEDVIERVSIIDTKSGITTTSPQNVATNQNLGYTASYKMRLFKWWTHTTTISAEYANMQGRNDSTNYANENLGASININSNFRLPKKFSIQLTGQYRTPRLMAQGTFRANNGMDLGIRKDMLKNNRLVLSLNISDIFFTRNYRSYYETPTFTQEYDRRRSTRTIRLNVRYRFGKIDPNLFRRKKQTQVEEKEEEQPPRTTGREQGL